MQGKALLNFQQCTKLEAVRACKVKHKSVASTDLSSKGVQGKASFTICESLALQVDRACISGRSVYVPFKPIPF